MDGAVVIHAISIGREGRHPDLQKAKAAGDEEETEAASGWGIRDRE